jgi:HPr kinase/phosphorylase
MYVKELYEKHAEELGLELIAGKEGLSRSIRIPEIERPGLSLTGYLKGFAQKRILIFGEAEIEYLKALSQQKRLNALQNVLHPQIPFIIVARRLRPVQEMLQKCEEQKIPLMRSRFTAMRVLNRLVILLSDAFAQSVSCHGSLVEIFGIGVLIQGDAAVGKSEAALGLIERGHRLISDDIVKIRKREGNYLEGCGVDVSRHHMEVKGVGIVNIARLYGAIGIREKKSLDIVVKLEVWDDSHFYDRNVLEEKTVALLGVEVPFHVLAVKPGRNVVLLLETIALNHRLKMLSAIERKGRSWEQSI